MTYSIRKLAVFICASFLSGCTAMQPVDAEITPGYYWHKERAADPAATIVFRVRTQSEITQRAGRPALAVASVGGPVCVVDTLDPWHKVSAELLLHELRHCAGWMH